MTTSTWSGSCAVHVRERGRPPARFEAWLTDASCSQLLGRAAQVELDAPA